MGGEDLGPGPFHQGDPDRGALSPGFELLKVGQGLLEIGKPLGQGVARGLKQQGQTLGAHAEPFRPATSIPPGGTPRIPWNEGSRR